MKKLSTILLLTCISTFLCHKSILSQPYSSLSSCLPWNSSVSCFRSFEDLLDLTENLYHFKFLCEEEQFQWPVTLYPLCTFWGMKYRKVLSSTPLVMTGPLVAQFQQSCSCQQIYWHLTPECFGKMLKQKNLCFPQWPQCTQVLWDEVLH